MNSARNPRWIGRWMAAVGLLHFIAGFLIYVGPWADIARSGIVASVRDFDGTATAFWFAVAGPLMIIVGGLVDHFEQNNLRLPTWLGWAMAALLIVLIVPMPATGAWLLLPPTVGLLIRGSRATSE